MTGHQNGIERAKEVGVCVRAACHPVEVSKPLPITVTKDGSSVSIDREVFESLLENSVANTYAGYEHALEKGQIRFSTLLYLARRGRIPYCLFFAPIALVRSQIRGKEKKLQQGISKSTFSVNTRDEVSLNDVEQILIDLGRKQQLVKRHDPTLTQNSVVGTLLRRRSIHDDARQFETVTGITSLEIRDAPTKEEALGLIIRKLEERQVLVSQSTPNYMPQQLRVPFSGLTIKDAKVPYIFLNGGDQGDYQEPAGRRVFTLVLLAVLVARAKFQPVVYKAMRSATIQPVHEHEVVGEILMPSSELANAEPRSLDEIKEIADAFRVTPSAMVVRLSLLQLIDPGLAAEYLLTLETEFEEYRRLLKQSRKQRGGALKAVNGVRKYNGRELSRRMLRVLDEGRISGGDFCREVCLNKILRHEIDEFREALK